jgi:Ser/Thr protein kinase RdoA (MazF antagonist)
MFDDILDSFSISKPATITQQYAGVINQTYKIMNSDGIFALQSMHPVFSDESLQDIQTVTNYLEQHGQRVPRLIPATNGDYVVHDHNNLRWRLYSWIDGRVFDKVNNPDIAWQAGNIAGKLHHALRDFSYTPQGGIPHFHDTLYILTRLEQVFGALPEAAQTLARKILQAAPATIIDESQQPTSIIHGDLKISNLIFDMQNQAIGIIDFDTIMRRCRAIDMGDALRSWCNRTCEDDPEARFDEDFFNAAEDGYRAGFDPTLDKRDLHRQAAKQIAYELAARFLIDIVDDNYFHYNAERYPSRQAHNFIRAISQYHLAISI